MYINHDDLVSLATGPSSQGDQLLKSMDREIVTYKRTVSLSKDLERIGRKTQNCPWNLWKVSKETTSIFQNCPMKVCKESSEHFICKTLWKYILIYIKIEDMTNFVMPSAWPSVLLKTVLILSSLNQGLLLLRNPCLNPWFFEKCSWMKIQKWLLSPQ